MYIPTLGINLSYIRYPNTKLRAVHANRIPIYKYLLYFLKISMLKFSLSSGGTLSHFTNVIIYKAKHYLLKNRLYLHQTE